MLTRSDVERGDRVVVTLSRDGEETEEHAGEVVALDDHRIRIEPNSSIATRIRVGLDGGGQPVRAKVETHHRELTREVEGFEFEG